MDRELEINLIFLKIKIRVPRLGSSEHEATLSRSASDWEFFKMNNKETRRPFTLTKSYAALNFICELEDQSRVCSSPRGEEEEEDYCLPHISEVSVSCHK